MIRATTAGVQSQITKLNKSKSSRKDYQGPGYETVTSPSSQLNSSFGAKGARLMSAHHGRQKSVNVASAKPTNL